MAGADHVARASLARARAPRGHRRSGHPQHRHAVLHPTL